MVLEPDHFASPHLDELSGMTYLSYFLKVRIKDLKGAYWIIQRVLVLYQILHLFGLFSLAYYGESNSCRSYSLIKAIAKSKGIINALSRS
jgi:hypothetical protein